MCKIIPIACDHAGFELKEFMKQQLTKRGFEIKDMGTYSAESVDYPDMIHPLAKAVDNGEFEFGIIMCGAATWVSTFANTYHKVRRALCWSEETAKLATQHNNANIIALPARFVSPQEALNIFDAYYNAEFEGGRHQRRIEKIPVK